ncbi:hypothetical protein CH294_10815 [Rhodococcus sp. 14-2483-1-1]|uniref:class III lanthionine synthetase LanKC n=1 Tax=Rhodococcus sp. 14-2483-1-1 TaxID=2023148 RepID=UPI000B9A98F0|nr:class III lanthionine synthetase LanKC [Rhodococcus sp. 14-2483-1-1]OZF36872.1 hypothetical protein CH294_10815 [Rhodococcus sp. 14-2483-1-1]
MDLRYLAYCQPGDIFYDIAPESSPSENVFGDAAAPDGWVRVTQSEWTMYYPESTSLPQQGWKIHISATSDNADRILAATHRYCVEQGVPYKHLRDAETLHRRNSKYADRGSSGKFVTVYPLSEDDLAEHLHGLDDVLSGFDAPYILSDLRWNSGPVYVRYGGFVSRLGRPDGGELVHCIEAPDGTLVADVRKPGFRVPAWVELPSCLVPAVAERNSGVLGDFPFSVTKALHYSNGGGVYRAVDTRTGADVLLKEARPLAGIDEEGLDAVARLEREHAALERMAALPCIPDLIDYRTGHAHRFLAREFVDGVPLMDRVMTLNPVVNPDSDLDRRGYVAWAESMMAKIEAALTSMHRLGLVFGDLHPHNILVRPNGDVAFIDFEATIDMDDDSAQIMGAPGFRAPASYRGAAIDRYAVGCLRIAMYLPLTPIMAWSAEKIRHLVNLAESMFELHQNYRATVFGDLGVTASRLDAFTGSGEFGHRADAGPLHDRVAELLSTVVADATPSRSDRLYPGDVRQFATPTGGVNFAFGASGVLWSLQACGVEAPDEHVDWLVRAAARHPVTSPGFFSGGAGTAFALDGLGCVDEADVLLRHALDLASVSTDHSLDNGVAGLGTALIAIGRRRGEREPVESAVALGAQMLLRPEPGPNDFSTPGLLHGASGTALYFVRLFEETGDDRFLVRARALLVHELRGLFDRTPTSTAVSGTDRHHVALETSGAAMVLADYLSSAPEDDELRGYAGPILDRLAAPFTINAGALRGRAGIVMALHRLHDGSEHVAAAIRTHTAHFGWHCVPERDTIAMLGDECLRISHDFGTGTAGVALALTTVAGTGSSAFPLFQKARVPA